MDRPDTPALAETWRQKKAFARKAFFIFAVNSILSSLSITLCSTIDAVVVGNIYGESGLAITGVVMPLYMLYNLLSFAFGVGGTALVSRAFGRNDMVGARAAFTCVVAFGLIAGVLLSVLGLLFLEPLVHLLGGGALGSDCVRYVMVVMAPAPLFVVTPILGLMLRVDADPALATVGVTLSCVTNLVLDLLFVVVLRMGIHGAAVAMVVGQTVAIGTYCIHFFRKRAVLRPVPTALTLKNLREIFSGGFASASAYAWQGIYIVVFNNLLSLTGGATGIAVFNALFNVSLFAYAIFDGVSLTIPTLVGTYLGENDIDSVKHTMRLALIVSVSMGLILTVLLLLFPAPIVALFGLRAETTLAIGVAAVRLYSLSVVAACLSSLLVSYYQTLQYTKVAGAANFLRGCVFMLGFGVPFILRWGALGAAGAIAAAELLGLTAMFVMVKIAQTQRELDSMFLIADNRERHNAVFEEVLSRDFSKLTAIAQRVSDFCEEQEIGPKESYLINLTIEELAANIVKFGFAKGKNHYIAIRVAKYDEDIYVRLRDDATDYNPFERPLGEAEDEWDLIGVNLIKAKAKDFIYQRKLVFNNLLIIL